MLTSQRGGCADGTKGECAPEKKEDNNGGEQEYNTGGSGAQGEERRGSQDMKETSGGEAPRLAIQGDQAGASQQAAGGEVQTVVAEAKGKAPAGATCQTETHAEQLPSAAGYGSLWKAYADKLSGPDSGGPSEQRTGGVPSASPGDLLERPGRSPEAGPEPWTEIVAALRGLIHATEEGGRVVAARLDTLLKVLEPLHGGGMRRGPRTTGGAAFETGTPSSGRGTAPSPGPATPPESPGQCPDATTQGGDVSKGRSEAADGGRATPRAGRENC